jgi:hypothetical protein
MSYRLSQSINLSKPNMTHSSYPSSRASFHIPENGKESRGKNTEARNRYLAHNTGPVEQYQKKSTGARLFFPPLPNGPKPRSTVKDRGVDGGPRKREGRHMHDTVCTRRDANNLHGSDIECMCVCLSRTESTQGIRTYMYMYVHMRTQGYDFAAGR